jgi:hypothetical protein
MKKGYYVIAMGILLSILTFGLAGAGNYADFGSASGGFGESPIMPLRSGGPDAYGYYFIDSQDSAFNAPEYNWIEISTYGTEIAFTGDDENFGPFLIGFTFGFYGVDFLTFRACTNGFVSFTSNSSSYSNLAIPNANEPNDLVAAFWDDLWFEFGGDAYYYSNNSDTLIIEWKEVPFLDGSGIATFEAIITANGNILFQYNTVTGTNLSHSIGIENQSGSVGLQYVYNTASDETGKAILYTLTEPDYGAKDILVLAADAANEYIAAIGAYSDIGTVDYFNGNTGTPTLGTLQGYDCVVVWSNSRFLDSTATGDILADFIDAGGAIVIQEFCFYQGYGIAGRLMSQYSPFNKGTSYARRTLGAYEAGHPLMTGIDALVDTYSVNVTLRNSPIVAASYNDGTPLVAYNPANKLVAINSYMGDAQRNGGDAIALSHNAINFATNKPAEILLLHADGGNASEARTALLLYPDIHGIDSYVARLSTPSLAFLQQYEVVVVWSDYPFSDSVMLGNRLADYLDSGGSVVMAMFCFAQSWQLSGRIMSSYSPFTVGPRRLATRTLGWHQPGHQLFESVNAITEYFTVNVGIRNGGVSVGSWDDSSPFVAYCPDRDLVAINGFVGDNNQFTGDMMILLHNAVNFSRHVGVEDGGGLPDKFELAQNYPNPFNPTTTIGFDIPRSSRVSLEVFNIIGQRVAVLNNGMLEAGHHTVTFDGSSLGSGVYFYRLGAGENVRTKKMLIVK